MGVNPRKTPATRGLLNITKALWDDAEKECAELRAHVKDAEEAMRAKCLEVVLKVEEIYTNKSEAFIMRNIREEIAALKGNGEGSESPSTKDQHQDNDD
jgi:hypothetical protein